MKVKTLLDQYKFSLKTYNVSMPISIAILVVAAVIAFIKAPVNWLGWLFLSLGAVVAVMFVLIRRYLIRKIKELEEQEMRKQSDGGSLDEGV